MQLIIGGRRSGKTAELIKRSAESGTYILVSSRAMASQIFDQARAMGYAIPFPVTLEEYYRSNGFAGSSIRRDGVYIDNVEDVLRRMFYDIEIKVFTCTIDQDTVVLSDWPRRNDTLIDKEPREGHNLAKIRIVGEFDG